MFRLRTVLRPLTTPHYSSRVWAHRMMSTEAPAVQTRFHLNAPGGFETNVFMKEQITLADRKEFIIRGTRDKLPLLPKAFQDIRQIGVIGWGSQGPAQAQNLRDSLEGTGIKVKVGLRPGSTSFSKAARAGFTVENGTLGEMLQVASESDLTIVLIADAAMASEHEKIIGSIKPGKYLGLSHGYLLGHLKTMGKDFRKDISVIGVCPKGMGPSVRQLYIQGKEVNGAGINASFAVHQDVSGRAVDVALGWAVGIGSPVIFQTTLEAEYKSDIVGERGVLLGAVHGICEVLYRHFVRQGVTKQEAYLRSVECIVGPISSRVSHGGFRAVYKDFSNTDMENFKKSFCAAYKPCLEMLLEIYEEVASGREIASVNDHVARFKQFPQGNIDRTELWRIGAAVRSERGPKPDMGLAVDPTTAGVYLACMTAQCDVFMATGHEYSEIANESIIEAVDSLNPYMAFKGVAYMVDNCSTTARLGSRKWAPRFDYIIDQVAMPVIEGASGDASSADGENRFNHFENHNIHGILETCLKLRPPVDIVPDFTHLGDI